MIKISSRQVNDVYQVKVPKKALDSILVKEGDWVDVFQEGRSIIILKGEGVGK